jgi:hypothetical protein
MAKAATTKVSIARFMFESFYGARRTEVEAISRAAPASRNADLKEENGSKATKMVRGKASAGEPVCTPATPWGILTLPTIRRARHK